MEDRVVPERPGGRHAVTKAQAEVPAMPVILPTEHVPDLPYPLLDGLSPTIGWHFRSGAKGGPTFVIMRRSALGSFKVVESFPLTQNGWASAWHSLVGRNPGAAPQVLARLQAREADAAVLRASEVESRKVSELDVRALVSLREVAYLGGYVPGSGIAAGQRYDVRFFEDRLVVFECRRAEVLAEVPYSQVEDVEIGGPGLIRTGGGFTGSGQGVIGAAEGIAIAAVLNALTTRTSVKTIVRIQGNDCELFLLHTRLTPEQLRIQMSHPLGAIRSVKATKGTEESQHGVLMNSASPVEELSKLADMLERGLLTREEFELMKATLLARRSYPNQRPDTSSPNER
jgi:hypothetical protein